MNYITALEQTPRNIYCGAIGLLLPNGNQSLMCRFEQYNT